MRWPAWLGVGERRWKKSSDEEIQPAKTVWDWLQLLVVPAMLVVIALLFNTSQASRERKREDRQIAEDRALAESAREDATLEAYFAQISSLMLDRDLLRSRPGSAVRQVARTATLTATRRVNGRRKGEIVRFLSEVGLLQPKPIGDAFSEATILLDGADLRGADLAGALLSGIDFFRVDLRGADLTHALLSENFFTLSDLRRSRFDYASVVNGSFERSDLRGASFKNGSITRTLFEDDCLTNARFVGAVFRETTFDGADGRNVDFSHSIGLDTTKISYSSFVAPRMEGVAERPHGWGPNGILRPDADVQCLGSS
jgi:Pentapeptide repeats (8 copies)